MKILLTILILLTNTATPASIGHKLYVLPKPVWAICKVHFGPPKNMGVKPVLVLVYELSQVPKQVCNPTGSCVTKIITYAHGTTGGQILTEKPEKKETRMIRYPEKHCHPLSQRGVQ